MSDQDWSKPLANPQHEKFAQLLASGLGKQDAYSRVNPTCSKASANTLGPRWFAKVRFRVQFLQQATADETVMDMKERRIFMRRVKRVDLAAFDMAKDGDLIQEIDYHEDGRVKKIKTPGKRECVMSDAELAGELIEKMDITVRQPLTPEQISEAVRRSPALAMIGRS